MNKLTMEKDENTSAVDSNSKLTCRTCANTRGGFYSINSNISYFTPTIKDMIILLVPQMETILDNNDIICIMCRTILLRCVKFIERCLYVLADHKNLSCQKAPENNSDLIDLKCHETLSSDVDYDLFSSPHNTNLDIDNGFDVEQDTCYGSKLNRDVHTDAGTNQVIKVEMDDIFSVVQKENNSNRLNEDFQHDLEVDQLLGIIKSENSDSVNTDISQIGLLKELPNSIPSHNRLISVSQLSTKELNEFIATLPSSDVKTVQLSESSQKNTGRKRIILVGSTFKCKLCSKYYVTRGKTDYHMRMHKRIEQKKVETEKLKKQRLHKLQEKRHRQLNALMSPYREKKCSNPKVDLECKTCLKKCSSKQDLAFHVKIHPPFVCEKCGKGFASKCQINAHKDVHNDPNSFLCEVCGKGYKNQSQLRAHMLLHANNSVLCNRCPKVFNTSLKLRKHLKYTHGEGLTNFWPCKECKKVFKTQSRLKAHCRLMHLREKQFTCKVCGQGFFRADYFKRHERRHIIYGDKLVKRRSSSSLPRVTGSYQCQICTKVLKSMHNLKLHIKSHGTLSRYSCKYCSMTFKIVYQRNRHEKLHEHSELKYRCGICWKRLESQEELDEHSLTHNNLKYKCESCEQSFARKHLLDHHIVNTHIENGDAEEEMRTLLAAGLGELNRSYL